MAKRLTGGRKPRRAEDENKEDLQRWLLTYADMRAVAPNVYNNWRDMLLSELYMKALKLLEHGHRETVEPARRLAVAKAEVKERLAQAGDRRVQGILEINKDLFRPQPPLQLLSGDDFSGMLKE